MNDNRILNKKSEQNPHLMEGAAQVEQEIAESDELRDKATAFLSAEEIDVFKREGLA